MDERMKVCWKIQAVLDQDILDYDSLIAETCEDCTDECKAVEKPTAVRVEA